MKLILKLKYCTFIFRFIYTFAQWFQFELISIKTKYILFAINTPNLVMLIFMWQDKGWTDPGFWLNFIILRNYGSGKIINFKGRPRPPRCRVSHSHIFFLLRTYRRRWTVVDWPSAQVKWSPVMCRPLTPAHQYQSVEGEVMSRQVNCNPWTVLFWLNKSMVVTENGWGIVGGSESEWTLGLWIFIIRRTRFAADHLQYFRRFSSRWKRRGKYIHRTVGCILIFVYLIGLAVAGINLFCHLNAYGRFYDDLIAFFDIIGAGWEKDRNSCGYNPKKG